MADAVLTLLGEAAGAPAAFVGLTARLEALPEHEVGIWGAVPPLTLGQLLAVVLRRPDFCRSEIERVEFRLAPIAARLVPTGDRPSVVFLGRDRVTFDGLLSEAVLTGADLAGAGMVLAGAGGQIGRA